MRYFLGAGKQIFKRYLTYLWESGNLKYSGTIVTDQNYRRRNKGQIQFYHPVQNLFIFLALTWKPEVYQFHMDAKLNLLP